MNKSWYGDRLSNTLCKVLAIVYLFTSYIRFFNLHLAANVFYQTWYTITILSYFQWTICYFEIVLQCINFIVSYCVGNNAQRYLTSIVFCEEIPQYWILCSGIDNVVSVYHGKQIIKVLLVPIDGPVYYLIEIWPLCYQGKWVISKNNF